MAAYQMFNNYSHFSQNQEYDITVDELTDQHPKAVQPPNTLIALRPHQLTLLQRCIDYENRPIKLQEFPMFDGNSSSTDEFRTSIGVIGDTTGSGKSMCCLALIMSNNIIEKDNTMVKSCGMNNILYFFKDKKTVVKTNVLVIPHNLSNQWETYIKTFSNTLKYKIINKQKVIDTLVEDNTDLTEIDLIVVTSTFFNKVCRMITDKHVKLQRIFFDEVDSLNIPGCYPIHANFYWFVTASYGNLLYPRGFNRYDASVGRHVWCATGIRNSGLVKNIFLDMFNHIPRDFMKVIIAKNSKAYVESSITLPEMITHVIKSKTPHSINILNGIVDKNIIECLNAGDVDRAITHINTNNKGTEENIITMMIDKYKKLLTNYNLRLSMTNDYVYENEEEKLAEIASITKKISDIDSKIKMITERIHDNEVCSICYDDIENKTITKCCQNPFCFKCIHIWLSKKAVCPLCKQKMLSTDVFVISETKTCEHMTEEEILDENEFNEKFDKWKNFEILIKKNKEKGNSKTLVFSNYDNTFTNVIPILNANGIRWDFVKGNGAQVNSIINKYKGDQLDLLLVNTRHYGTGMNLENTSDVILFHKFDVSSEQQVIGRAQRYGRLGSLNVHYLLYENEIRTPSV